jgi:hypothetical protein
MEPPVLLQTGPETFQIMLGEGRRVAARLPHHTRRGLGLQGVPPLTVATEIVAFLLEREGIDAEREDELVLGAAAGRYPEFVDELRGRLS